jgi:hypothetical protein
MDLETLYLRLQDEQGEYLDRKEVKIMTPGGKRFDILSLNWDEKAGEWVIIGE